jgi:hypothetical protein
MGITSNYILAGTGTSDERRQHIVEFGSFWNRCYQEGESTTDAKHLGSSLFGWKDDDDEWMSFFNFGFRCVQEYLKTGLQPSSSSNYKTKSIKLMIEGEGSNGQGVDWLINWVKTDRLRTNIVDISENDLYFEFRKDNIELLEDSGGQWSQGFFSSALFKLVDNNRGWYYNKHLARNGNTKSARRWQVGTRGNQISWLKITTDCDDEWRLDYIHHLEAKTSITDDESGDRWIKEFEEAM